MEKCVVRVPDAWMTGITRRCLLVMIALLSIVVVAFTSSADYKPSLGIRVSDGSAFSVFGEYGSRNLSLGFLAGMRDISIPEIGNLSIHWFSAYLRAAFPIRFIEPFAAIGPTLQQYQVSKGDLTGYTYLYGADLRAGIEISLDSLGAPLSIEVATLVSLTTTTYTYVGVGEPVVTWEISLRWRFP